MVIVWASIRTTTSERRQRGEDQGASVAHEALRVTHFDTLWIDLVEYGLA